MKRKLAGVADRHRRRLFDAGFRKAILPAITLSAWASPVIQTVLLPVHAQTSLCTQADIPGRWQLELFGVAIQSEVITLFEDGSATHPFINAWQFADNQILMIQGLTWALSGQLDACNAMSGTYTNLFTNPILGNIIIRRGDWQATKLV